MQDSNILTKRLGIAHPIIQAPMAGAATPALAAAVSNAGGLGSLGLATSAPEDAARMIQSFRQQSSGPLNANFFCHGDPGEVTGTAAEMRQKLQPLYEAKGLGAVPEPSVPFAAFGAAHLAMIQEHKPEVVSFHFGLPDLGLLGAVKETGALVLSSATTVAEARWLEAKGVDVVIAQGLEAGGHRGTFLGADPASQPGLFALLPQVVSAVKVPVIAAGGIADGRGVAAALVLGASAAQIGTAFLRCPETGLNPAYQAALAAGADDSTAVTRLFSGKPARAQRNRLIEDFAHMETKVAPYPAQTSLVAPLRKDADAPDIADTLSMWSGQSAALTRVLPAADLVATLVREAEESLSAARI